jgi:hypothetical protein
MKGSSFPPAYDENCLPPREARCRFAKRETIAGTDVKTRRVIDDRARFRDMRAQIDGVAR